MTFQVNDSTNQSPWLKQQQQQKLHKAGNAAASLVKGARYQRSGLEMKLENVKGKSRAA